MKRSVSDVVSDYGSRAEDTAAQQLCQFIRNYKATNNTDLPEKCVNAVL